MENEKEMPDELKDCMLDFSKDYRRELKHWKIDKDGNLIWLFNKYGTNKSYYVITKERLSEDDWLSHMKEKLDNDEYGEFVYAYLAACERAGIRELTINIYGFDGNCKFANEV